VSLVDSFTIIGFVLAFIISTYLNVRNWRANRKFIKNKRS
jgi:hypothetical protein